MLHPEIPTLQEADDLDFMLRAACILDAMLQAYLYVFVRNEDSGLNVPVDVEKQAHSGPQSRHSIRRWHTP